MDPPPDLVGACARLGIEIDAIGTVSERDAAEIVGLSHFTLRNRRRQDRPIHCTKRGRDWRYALDDVAIYMRGNPLE